MFQCSNWMLPSYVRRASKTLMQTAAIKCCKDTKITFLPNECRNIQVKFFIRYMFFSIFSLLLGRWRLWQTGPRRQRGLRYSSQHWKTQRSWHQPDRMRRTVFTGPIKVRSRLDLGQGRLLPVRARLGPAHPETDRCWVSSRKKNYSCSGRSAALSSGHWDRTSLRVGWQWSRAAGS